MVNLQYLRTGEVDVVKGDTVEDFCTLQGLSDAA